MISLLRRWHDSHVMGEAAEAQGLNCAAREWWSWLRPTTSDFRSCLPPAPALPQSVLETTPLFCFSGTCPIFPKKDCLPFNLCLVLSNRPYRGIFREQGTEEWAPSPTPAKEASLDSNTHSHISTHSQTRSRNWPSHCLTVNRVYLVYLSELTWSDFLKPDDKTKHMLLIL